MSSHPIIQQEETVYGMTTSTTSVEDGSNLNVASSSGSNPANSTSSGSDPNAVMNDKVQALAGSVYEEFETMMSKFGPDVVKNLMPLIVNVLESLDLAYTESQELEVEVELLKEDNEQLVTQYEREKGLRKSSEARLIELEDLFEGDKKENLVKLESLTSIVKMFELKAKNSQDQISRLDEKETEMKKEYGKLHVRYTELFKTHIDYMERTKSMLGTEKLEQLHGIGTARNKIPASLAVNQINNRSSGPVSFGYSELENNNSQQPSIMSTADEYNFNNRSGNSSSGKLTSLQNELRSPQAGDTKGKMGRWMEGVTPDAEINDLELEDVEDVSKNSSVGPATPMTPMTPGCGGQSQTKAETRTGNTLYQELSFQDSEAIVEVDEGADITDNESESEELKDNGLDNDNVSDNYFGMGKEVENLISENNELLATKNALNIVKDDLIAKVDELTGEHEILREEIKSLQTIRSRLEKRTKELEGEIKKMKEEAEEKAKASKPEEDEDIPMAQRKRFTRVEMARVLMERNQYKERFMELQEAVRWTEMMRASKTTEPQAGGGGGFEKKGSKHGIWKFFGNLFSGSTDYNPLSNSNSPTRQMKYSTSSGNIGLGSRGRPSNQSAADEDPSGATLPNLRAKSSAERKGKGAGGDLFDGDTLNKSSERKEQYKQVRAHVKKEDGRMQAYGWSLPAKQSSNNDSEKEKAEKSSSSDVDTQVQSRSSASGVPVPVPVYCRPLMEKEPGMKIWCAAGVNQTGGRTRDGGDIVGASVFYNSPPEQQKADLSKSDDEVKKLDQELEEAKKVEAEAREQEHHLSSHVWICTSTHAISKVTVIDANSPSEHLESFHVCSSHLLCIASVPGAKESDYIVDEDLNRELLEESDKRESERIRQEREKEDEKERQKLSLIKPDEVPGGGGVGSITFVKGDDDELLGADSGRIETGEEAAEEEEEYEEPIRETQPRLTKETAVELGSKAALNRTMDVFKLQELNEDPDPHATLPFISHHTLNISRDLEDGKNTNKNPPGANADTIREEGVSESTDAVHRRLSQTRSPSAQVKDGVAEMKKENDKDVVFDEVEKMSSVLPTMWLGSQSGSIYVHSAVSQWKRCIHSIRLKDSILSIVHVKGRVLASLANGTIAIFHRSPSDAQWDLINYHLLDLGQPRQSIRCMIQVYDKVWCGYRDKIFVVDPRTMSVESTFDAHPRKESQVRQMAWVGDGVWVSIRLDSTLRLFHAHTSEHLQDVDIEPYVSKMLGTGKLGFSFVRITALLVSNFRLWMGTGNGVIISVPLTAPQSLSTPSSSHDVISEALKSTKTQSSGPMVPPGSTVRVYANKKEKIRPESFIPYCNMANAQLSFHGHRDAVKFFVSVPGHGGLALNPTLSPTKSNQEDKEAASMLVMSGGEGYIDFRIGEIESGDEVGSGSKDVSYGERSHLIVWQVPFIRTKEWRQKY